MSSWPSLFPAHPYPDLMSSWVLWDEFREGSVSRSPPKHLCILHWQRCELCPHKDGALKRTDNGGEGTLSTC